MTHNTFSKVITGIVALGILFSSGVAFAKTNGSDNDDNNQKSKGNNGIGWMMRNNAQGIIGTVTAVSGTTLTVNGKTFAKDASSLSYTVNAASATVYKDGAVSSLANIVVGNTVFVDGTVSGASVNATAIHNGTRKGMGRMKNGGDNAIGHFDVSGTVATVNGSTLTVAASNGTTYTVNAGSATVYKNGVTSTIANVLVGDAVKIKGIISGTTVTATIVYDGTLPAGVGGGSAALIQGNGQPVVAGTVTAVSGTTITMTNKSNVTYTINAASATVVKAKVSSTVASIAVGDNLVVQGTVNGTSITASSIVDGGPTSTTTTEHKGMFGGFFGGMGGFLKKVFGFF
ncbi:MAG: hypothetical protein HGA67_00180 [Candidatus Yonathbacteria bacterium]|nr:hypothetical protein [Candidatus Yonathbacteria bacterium]